MERKGTHSRPVFDVIEIIFGVVGILATAYLADRGLGYHSIWPGAVGISPTIVRIVPRLRFALIRGSEDD